MSLQCTGEIQLSELSELRYGVCSKLAIRLKTCEQLKLRQGRLPPSVELELTIKADHKEIQYRRQLERWAGAYGYMRDSPASLIIEILGGTDFPIADHRSSDPYVLIDVDTEEGSQQFRSATQISTLNPSAFC